MTISISFPGGIAVDATLNGHTIHTDQPQPLGSAARVRRVRARRRSPNMTCSSPPVLLCRACGTLFEQGVADPAPNNAPRCPQCGLADAAPTITNDGDFVVREDTKFR